MVLGKYLMSKLIFKSDQNKNKAVDTRLMLYIATLESHGQYRPPTLMIATWLGYVCVKFCHCVSVHYAVFTWQSQVKNPPKVK